MNRRQMLLRAAAAMGGALAGPVAMAVRAGAEPGAAIVNRVFTEEQRAMTAAIAELIIPKTDTPGAGEAGAPEFIEMMVSDWYQEDQRRSFFARLRDFDNHCKSSFGASFLKCSRAQQVMALEDAEANAIGSISDGKPGAKGNDGAVQVGDPAMWGDGRSDAGAGFFNEIKSLTVLGYYTSEVGIMAELIYDPTPGAYDGDVDFKTYGKHFIS